MVVASCSSAAPAETTGFVAAPLTSTMGDLGLLAIAVRTSPQPPTQGLIEVQLTVTNAASGEPVDGLSVSMTPFMPSMGHGSSVIPTVKASGKGKYLLSNVVLQMAGEWELRTSLSGATTDSCVPVVDVP